MASKRKQVTDAADDAHATLADDVAYLIEEDIGEWLQRLSPATLQAVAREQLLHTIRAGLL